MKKVSGKLKFVDIEGGVWRLEANNGKVYDLTNADFHRTSHGKDIEILGTVRQDAVGIGMGGGPTLEVERHHWL